MTDYYQYDVALSFAGEDRHHAELLADILLKHGVTVFYDKHDRASLWGKDLYQHLQTIYRDSAKFCVVFISEFYSRKLWTRHELVQAQARAFQESHEYILPVRLDDTSLPGLNHTTGYLDLRQVDLKSVSESIISKLSQTSGWDTWHETKTDIAEFNIKLRTELDAIVSLASSTALRLLPEGDFDTQDLVLRAQHAFQAIRFSSSLDIELTCLDDTGVYVYHPWPGVIGCTLTSQWTQRTGFADWFLYKARELRRGYLTWKDNYSSSPTLELELVFVPRPYERRTIVCFRRMPIAPQVYWTIAAEGHEIASLGSLQSVTRLGSSSSTQ